MKIRLSLKESVAGILREIPTDAQYIELTGAMKRNPRLVKESGIVAIELPINLKSYEVDESWNDQTSHVVFVIHETHMTHRVSEGFSIGEAIPSFEVVGVGQYSIEPTDGQRIANYIESRASLSELVRAKIIESIEGSR